MMPYSAVQTKLQGRCLKLHMFLQVDDSPPDTPRADGKAGGSTEDESKVSEEPQTRKAAKPKKPKVKKVTTAQVAAGMSSADLATLLESVEQKYKTDERNQLGIITDHFLSTFRECDIPFNKTVLEQPLSKVTLIGGLYCWSAP